MFKRCLIIFCFVFVSFLGAEHSPIGIVSKGSLFVVSGPAGSGKTTLVDRIVKEFPTVVANVSYTTREPRPGEKADVQYHFVSVKEFEAMLAKDQFLEHVKLFGNYYGTSLKSIQDEQMQGHHVILVIDTQGGLRIRPKIAATYIFIKPPEPALQTLRERLTKRNTETADVIEKRVQQAKTELEEGSQYEYLIVNDDLDTAYDVLRSIIIATVHRTV